MLKENSADGKALEPLQAIPLYIKPTDAEQKKNAEK